MLIMQRVVEMRVPGGNWITVRLCWKRARIWSKWGVIEPAQWTGHDLKPFTEVAEPQSTQTSQQNSGLVSNIIFQFHRNIPSPVSISTYMIQYSLDHEWLYTNYNDKLVNTYNDSSLLNFHCFNSRSHCVYDSDGSVKHLAENAAQMHYAALAACLLWDTRRQMVIHRNYIRHESQNYYSFRKQGQVWL